MSDHWQRKFKITNNNTYDFPPYIKELNLFPLHSSPTILPCISPFLLMALLQLKQQLFIQPISSYSLHHNSLHRHSLPLIRHHSICCHFYLFFVRCSISISITAPPLHNYPCHLAQMMNYHHSYFSEIKHHLSSAPKVS